MTLVVQIAKSGHTVRQYNFVAVQVLFLGCLSIRRFIHLFQADSFSPRTKKTTPATEIWSSFAARHFTSRRRRSSKLRSQKLVRSVLAVDNQVRLVFATSVLSCMFSRLILF